MRVSEAGEGALGVFSVQGCSGSNPVPQELVVFAVQTLTPQP